VSGGQCHTLTYVLSFCQKVSSNGKTELLFLHSSTQPKRRGGDQRNQEERATQNREKPKKNKTRKEERHDTENFESMNLRKIEAIEVKINLGEF
jgi:hypothetical protein